MTDELNKNEQSEQAIDSQKQINGADDYIQALNELKANTVNKADYDALEAEKKKLVKALLNGEQASTAEVENHESIDELRDDLFNNPNLSNLEYCQKALELRSQILQEQGIDIFVGTGHKINPSQEDYEVAERVASVMQECIEYAQGDSEAFTNELMRRTNDVRIPRR